MSFQVRSVKRGILKKEIQLTIKNNLCKNTGQEDVSRQRASRGQSPEVGVSSTEWGRDTGQREGLGEISEEKADI